jgi:hypothetical protein
VSDVQLSNRFCSIIHAWNDENMDHEIAAPRASSLVASLRGVGYSAQTAIADIVDNSVSAGARSVWLQFSFDGPGSTVSILDDGRGMSEDELRQAMVLGAKSPLEERDSSDLGRFGLGLKTASFSQCRCLTVASRKAGRTSVRRWDLDQIVRGQADDWRLMIGPRAGSEMHVALLKSLSTGTLVLWEDVDRLTAGTPANDRRAEDSFLDVVGKIEEHLAMVFHQFLGGQGPELQIFINGRRIKPWDPFMTAKANPTPTEVIPAGAGVVGLQGFVLPHKDQLSEDEIRSGGGPEGWAAQQGFYIYRNRRLLVAGGWLGLGEPRAWTMEEPYRLARLRVEFGTEADIDWEIDVKKSVARPPRSLRPRLTALAEIVRDRARRVFAHRGTYGRRSVVPDMVPAWVTAAGSGSPRYRVNRGHAAIAQAIAAAGSHAAHVEAALTIIEATVPIERIWLDTADQGEVAAVQPEAEVPPALLNIGRSMLSHWTNKLGLTIDQALERLQATDPFHNYPGIADLLSGQKATGTDA